MKLPKNPWIILFIAIVVYALIFLVAKFCFKLDTRWLIADIPVGECLFSDQEIT